MRAVEKISKELDTDKIRLVVFGSVVDDMKDEFDRIWKWAKTYMFMDYGRDEGYFAYRHMDKLTDIPKDTDCYMVKNGIISVCPLQRTYYSETLFNKLNNKIR